MNVSETILRLAKEKGITVKTLAAMTGIKYPTLYAALHRSSGYMSQSMLGKVADALEVEPEQLITSSGPGSEKELSEVDRKLLEAIAGIVHYPNMVFDQKVVEEKCYLICDFLEANTVFLNSVYEKIKQNTNKNTSTKRPVEIQPGLPDPEGFSALLDTFQQYLSITLTEKDIEIVSFMYDTLRMPRDLIEYLVKLCAMKGRKSLRYIECVAKDWHSQGIMTVEDAKEWRKNHVQTSND